MKTKDWPYVVIDFYLGRRSLDEVRPAAANANDKSAFYIGELQLLRGNKAESKASLQIAADTCPRTFIEYHGAISELRRLDQ